MSPLANATFALAAGLLLASASIDLSAELGDGAFGFSREGTELAVRRHRDPPPPRFHVPPCAKAKRAPCWMPGSLESETSVAALASPSAKPAA